ncbi:MAG: protein phosphatase CheZ [Alphaproteobacteria bacterium]|nr:protein phosphatase CheZ [Alphaproteobacteria bacterium]MBF0130021.1 protein phosphatase CheZ [Alphaproteobacteria bacterium]
MPGEEIDPELARRLRALHQEGGGFVRIEQIAGVIGELLERIREEHSRQEVFLYRELGGLSEYIKAIKAEIAALRPYEIQNHYLQVASDELDAIVDATEAATHAILGAAEEIEDIAGRLDDMEAVRLTEIATRVYEACTFQDITGQRIGKVVRALKVIEERVMTLVAAFGPGVEERAERGEASAGAAELLNGPQLGGDASRQDEIDALFSGNG